MFSSRTQWNLTPNKIISSLNKLQNSGFQIINLTESNPAKCGFEYPKKDMLSKLVVDKNIDYNPSPRGLLRARHAVASLLNADADDILLTASTSEAYSSIIRLLTDPGDNILVPRPSYPLFDYLAQLNDAEINIYLLAYKDEWNIDFESMEASISERTKAIVVVNPNNPTGSFIKEQERQKIAEICKSRNIALISDEVFWDYKLDADKKSITSLIKNDDCLTFVFGGASKSLALPQMKISWTTVSGPKDIKTRAMERLDVILDTYLSVNTPSQNALPEWLGLRENIQKEIKKRLISNKHILEEKLSKECLKIEGGWYAVLKLPLEFDEDEFTLKLLERDHVFVHPGYFFDFKDSPYIVISLLPQPEEFKEGIDRIIKRLI